MSRRAKGSGRFPQTGLPRRFSRADRPSAMKKAVRLVERSQGTADGGVGVEQPQKLLHNNVNDKARSARPTVPVARSKLASESVRFSPSARAQETRRCANVQLTAHEAVDHNRVTDSTIGARCRMASTFIAADRARCDSRTLPSPWRRSSCPEIWRCKAGNVVASRASSAGADRLRSSGASPYPAAHPA